MRKCAAAAIALLVTTIAAQAATDPLVKCQQTKLKALGKARSCLARTAAGVLGGKDDDSSGCLEKFTSSIAKADEKAAAAMTSCRFLDNGDGTMSDLDTGLEWELKTNLDNVVNLADPHDADNGYQWSATSSIPNGNLFSIFLGSLNAGSSTDGGAGTTITGCFANHCDWRLPSVVELRGIEGESLGPVKADLYWSATAATADPTLAWTVNFDLGGVASALKVTGHQARAVRGGL